MVPVIFPVGSTLMVLCRTFLLWVLKRTLSFKVLSSTLMVLYSLSCWVLDRTFSGFLKITIGVLLLGTMSFQWFYSEHYGSSEMLKEHNDLFPSDVGRTSIALCPSR